MTSLPKPKKHTASIGYIHTVNLINVYLANYSNDLAFRAAVEQLVERHRPALTQITSVDTHLWANEGWGYLQSLVPTSAVIREYYQDLLRLVEAWSLDLLPDDAGTRSLHSCCCFRAFMPRVPFSLYFGDRVSVPLVDGAVRTRTRPLGGIPITFNGIVDFTRESPQQAKQRLAAEMADWLNEQIAEIEDRYRASGFDFDSISEVASTYAEMLYRRVVYRERDYEIAANMNLNHKPTTVRERSREYARAIGIDRIPHPRRVRHS